MATTEQTEPLAITDAAHALKLGYWRLRDAILRGEVVGYKIAGKWFVTPDSVRRFAQKRSNGNGQQ